MGRTNFSPPGLSFFRVVGAIAAPGFPVSPPKEGGSPPGHPSSAPTDWNACSWKARVRTGAFHNRPRPRQGIGIIWVGGLRASPRGSHHLGITASWRRLRHGCKQCSLPQLWFSGTPKSLACHPRDCGRGRQRWEASGCSRCFQLTFQNGLLLAAGRAGGRGEEACGTLGRRAHP